MAAEDVPNGAEDDGFTLVELLIVMLVLGILAGIAVFAATGVGEHARDACQSANARIDRTVSAVQAVGMTATTTSSGC